NREAARATHRAAPSADRPKPSTRGAYGSDSGGEAKRLQAKGQSGLTMLSRLVMKGIAQLAAASVKGGVRAGKALARRGAPDHFVCGTCGFEIPTTGF